MLRSRLGTAWALGPVSPSACSTAAGTRTTARARRSRSTTRPTAANEHLGELCRGGRPAGRPPRPVLAYGGASMRGIRETKDRLRLRLVVPPWIALCGLVAALAMGGAAYAYVSAAG